MEHQDFHSQLEEHEGQEKAVGRANWMSDEEARIRGELEKDIENNLEGEIKDEMYRLALRLHDLYQHKKNKNTNNKSDNNISVIGRTRQVQLVQGQVKNTNADNKISKALSEVNIRIKMEGDTKVEIKEIKKPKISIDRGNYGRPYNINKCSKNGNGRFDWANSLRSDSGPPKSWDKDNVVVRYNKEISGKGGPKDLGPRPSKGNKSAERKLPQIAWK